MIFHPSQSNIAMDNHRFRVVNCGRRFGKTMLAINEMAGKAYAKNNRKICYIAPTYQQARDIAWVELVKLLNPIATKINETRLEITVQTQNKGKSTIVLRGWESVDTLRGQAFDFLILDEVASMRNFEVNWNMILRPTLTDTAGTVLFISTPKGFNHFYDLYNMQNDKVKGVDYKSFHYTSYDNPFLPKEELEKAKNEMSADQFAQEYLADFRKQEGLVYKEFDRSVHLYEERPRRTYVSFMGAVDFGYTNPCAVLEVWKDFDYNYWVEDEFYRTGQTDAKVADYVKSRKFNYVFPDPENPAAIEELTQRGINVREVVKGKDSIRNGISRVREMFKANKLKINKRCINLITELESYHYDIPNSEKNEKENPVKDNDHALDALRYLILTDAIFRRRQFTANTEKYDKQFE
jgi:PBSX family phage terminase large subunit